MLAALRDWGGFIALVLLGGLCRNLITAIYEAAKTGRTIKV